MTKPRIAETADGIQDVDQTVLYDRMMRRLRDRNWMETALLLKLGLSSGSALEVGPGPGYLGLEWLAKTKYTHLAGLEISPAMIRLARKNAGDYGLTDRVRYVQGDAAALPFSADEFDVVFSNGSLHEWEHPWVILNEIWRVLKPGGGYCISDLRRDMRMPVKIFLRIMTRPRAMRRGLTSSINAAYTPDEIGDMIQNTPLRHGRVEANAIGVVLQGRKPK